MHVVSGEQSVVFADVGFIEELTEVGMRTTKAAIEDAGKGSFWVATVGGCMTSSIFMDESEK